MKKIIILSGLLISILVFQTNIQAAEASTCTILKNSLRLGSRDASTNGDVTAYQKFLVKNGYMMNAAPTGYFGPLTVQATKKFQLRNLVKADGIIGVNGRKIVALNCNSIPAAPDAPIQSNTGNTPTSSSTSIPEKLQILRVDGPSVLKKGEVGTWTVVTNIPTKNVPSENTNYMVNWGVGYTNTYRTKTFTQSYAVTGFYTINITMFDPVFGGVEFKKNIKITDVEDQGITVTAPVAGQKYKVGDTLNIKWNGPMRLVSITDLDNRIVHTLTQLAPTQASDTSGIYRYMIPASVLQDESGRFSASVYKSFGTNSDDIFDTSDEFIINRGCVLPQKWSGYTCVVPPASPKIMISSVSSTAVLPGSVVTIYGKDFDVAEDRVSLEKGGRHFALATINQISSNQIVFIVPNVAADSYVLRVTRGEYAKSDDITFNVIAPVSVTNPSLPLKIDLLSPNDTVNYTAGNIIPIRWSSNASANAMVTILLERHDDKLNGRNAVTVKTIRASNSGQYDLQTTLENANKQFPCPNGCSTEGLNSVFGVRVILTGTVFDESDSFFSIIN